MGIKFDKEKCEKHIVACIESSAALMLDHKTLLDDGSEVTSSVDDISVHLDVSGDNLGGEIVFSYRLFVPNKVSGFRKVHVDVESGEVTSYKSDVFIGNGGLLGETILSEFARSFSAAFCTTFISDIISSVETLYNASKKTDDIDAKNGVRA